MMCGANCWFTRFHDRSSVRMNTMFGRDALAADPAGAEVADPLPLLPPLLHDAATSAPTSATVASRTGLRTRLVNALGDELLDFPCMDPVSRIVNRGCYSRPEAFRESSGSATVRCTAAP